MVVVLGTSAIITIVGWAASPVINRLIGKAKSYAVKKYKWHQEVPEKLKSVGHFLDEIGTTVSLVEARGIKNPNMICWLSQLKGAIDEVDDLFDILDYEILKSKAEDPSAESGTRSIGSDESSERLKKLLKKLDDIRQSSRGLVQASMLDLTAGCSNSRSGTTSRPVTGPLLPQEPLGYSIEYGKLIALLVPQDLEKPKEGSSINGTDVIAITGHGGMGKTTLAQKACADPAVKKRFKLVIWAWVYNKFSEADLLGEIWRSAAAAEPEAVPARHGEMSFSSMQQALEKLVAAFKTYLLVLDDVCNDETATDLQRRETWTNVLAPFQHGERGSRVLMTSRAMICAQTIGASRSSRITLDGIDHDSFMCLLKKTAAFGSEEEDTRARQLQEVLKSSALFSSASSPSVSAWKGSPLSAKEMGLKLRNTRIRKKWEDILTTDCHENAISAHVSSYQQLPPHLQYCFAFLSLFPNKFEFHAEILVKMWIAHGFISDDALEDGIRTMEDTASRYFNDLLFRSFLQEIKAGQELTHYVVHEQIHSMIRSVSANYFLMVEGNNSDAKGIPQTVRHLSVRTTGCLGCLLAQLKKHGVLERLRTLLIFRDYSGPSTPCACRNSQNEKDSCPSLTTIDKDILSELNGVRVLDLTGTDIAKLPPEIGNLIHLRYLALPGTLKELPKEFSKLLHLQALIKSDDIQTAKVNNGKKPDLSFRFSATDETGLKQLGAMNSLRGSLCITGLDAISNKQDAQKAQLRKKKSVKDLKFEWDNQGVTSGCSGQHQDVLEGLQPNTGILVLQIRRYRGISSPSWLVSSCLGQLTRLHVINCRKWVTLPAFGHLPRLNHLHIQEMESVTQIDDSGPFKSLETLVLSDMKSLIEWTAGAADSGFTILKNIQILDCPKLELLPPAILLKTVNREIEQCPKLQYDVAALQCRTHTR